MSVFGWEEKYSVGIQSIDDQHQEIFRIMDRLFLAQKEGKAQELILQIITELENYTVSHFHREEFFFELFKFEDSAEHIKEHNQFLQKITVLKAQAISGNLSTSYELLHFLKVWINHHIQVVDMAYSEHFQKNGLL